MTSLIPSPMSERLNCTISCLGLARLNCLARQGEAVVGADSLCWMANTRLAAAPLLDWRPALRTSR